MLARGVVGKHLVNGQEALGEIPTSIDDAGAAQAKRMRCAANGRLKVFPTYTKGFSPT